MSQIIRDITEIARCGSQYRTDRLAPMGLKACHASYLMEICDCPGISQERLAGLICINKSNVARQAAILEEDGFITRTPSPADKRVLQLYPTEKTLASMQEIRGIMKCWEDCISHDLTEEEKEVISSLLAKMKTRAAAYMEDR